MVFSHHGLWHGGRRNDSDAVRYMFKIRFNPTVRQRRLWDTSDLGDPRVAEELSTTFPWYEHATGRLEIYHRVLLARALTGMILLRPGPLGDPGLQPAQGGSRMNVRQQILVLYLATSALDSEVVGWSAYDGTVRTSPTTGDSDEPPDALVWMPCGTAGGCSRRHS